MHETVGKVRFFSAMQDSTQMAAGIPQLVNQQRCEKTTECTHSARGCRSDLCGNVLLLS